MLLAHPVETGIAFDTLMCVHDGSPHHRINRNRAHGTNVRAIATGHAFVGINLHEMRLLASIFKKSAAATSHSAAVTKTGISQPYFAAVTVATVAEIAPPR